MTVAVRGPGTGRARSPARFSEVCTCSQGVSERSER